MPATGNEIARLLAIGEHRGDGRDIRQMSAAMKGVVAENGLAFAQGKALSSSDLLKQINDGFTHRSKVNGNVGSIGDKCSLVVKNSAGEVQPFADIHRTTRLP
ncbi:MAG: Uncharacterised protein [Prochlorococcus marinus str. MIT 9215]|nr:MAG: Uncharacterised protein [Prochlorococcus marinus str. MIT 9215]